jgi:hypothetical protein
MNMLKKGPDIKLSDLKVPDFLSDLYFDLKDRHLLPLVVLLLLAIVAVPIALGQSGSEEPETAAESAIATPSAVSSKAGVLVAKAAPGLRDYRKRLDRMRAEDPFEQQFSAEEDEESSSSGLAGSEGEPVSSASPPETFTPESPPPTGSDGEPGPGELTYFSYAIDVRVVPGGSPDGESSGGEAQVRRNLPELTMLPSRSTPAIVYMGSTKDGKKALMMVSSDVQAIFGDGKCVLGSDSCQLLMMEPSVPETFVYGGENRTFKIELLKVHLVTTDKLNRAPLGKPKKGKSDKGGGQFRQK